jgi:thermitase
MRMGKRAVLLLTVVAAMLLALSGVVLAQSTTPNPSQTKGSEREQDQVSSEDIVPGEILVKFKRGASAQAIEEANRRNGGRVKETIPGLDIRVVGVSRGQELARSAAYERNPNVEYAEPNLVRQTDEGHFDPNDEQDGKQWQYNNTGQTGGKPDADIDAFDPDTNATGGAWDITKGSNTVAIAILDTGIKNGHPDIPATKVKNGADCTTSSGSCTVPVGTPEDNQGHGTHVAGIAGAATDNGVGVAGTCPACVLSDVKVLDDSGYGSSSRMIKGIKWAADDGAKVINMSLGGGGFSQAEQDAVNYAWDEKGVVLVASAGNNKTSKAHYPSDYNNVIGVAGTNSSDDRYWWTNYGTKVEVAAPGESILSTTNDGKYGTKSGTSMASPHVAGVAGLVWSVPTLATSKETVRNRIFSGVDKIAGSGKYWNYGRINACKAVGGACT